MSINIALYARVSSEKQVQKNTIDSQIAELKNRIKNDGHILLNDYIYIDDGYSGSTLLRPSLERLRDDAANNLFDFIYVHSPDRLARKYAYQYLLMEEIQRLNIGLIFINHEINNNPEANLLLQVQGMISEYERTKILERSRRGKIHAAQNGQFSVLAGAPYGYKYFPKRGDGVARYEIFEDEAKIVRQLFNWVAIEKLSINAAALKLTDMGVTTRKSANNIWNRGSVRHMLNNPAYKGMAAFGKRKAIERKERVRPNKGHAWQPKNVVSSEIVPKNEWLYIPVPKIIDEHIFDIVQAQFVENKKLKRERKTGAKYLLQGLVVCNRCGYGFTGSGTTQQASVHYRYYICTGSRTYANRKRACFVNGRLSANDLEDAVWQEVINLLSNTSLIEKEYHRRKKELSLDSANHQRNKLNIEKTAAKNKIDNLIDAYTNDFITKDEFEPRITTCRAHANQIEMKILQLVDDQNQHIQVQKFMEKLEFFKKEINNRIMDADWQTKRNILVSLIKLIEIDGEHVNIIFKINPPDPVDKNLLVNCAKVPNSSISKYFISKVI
jgi:site-specific DNA recombinase